MRNFWLDAFICPEDYDGLTWNVQVIDYASWDEIDLVCGQMESGEAEDELILTFMMSDQTDSFDLDELIDDLENSVEAVFDAVEDGDVLMMHTVFVWDCKASYEVTKKDVKVTWRFKHRCLFKGVW